MAEAAVRLAENVWRIPTAPFSGTNSFAFLDGDGQVTLVDCGMSFAPPRIVAGLAAFGKHPRDVTRIVLTHAHADHAGGAAKIRARTGAPVAVHADDAGFARRGEIPPPDTSRTAGRLFARFGVKRFPPLEVGQELRDGDELDVGGGLRVVHTPGHTPGHVSLLHPGSGVLVTGDCIQRARHPVVAEVPVHGPASDPGHRRPTGRPGVRRRRLHARAAHRRACPRARARLPHVGPPDMSRI